MFSGMTDHTIDSRGRIVLPTAFRELLGESFILTKGLSDCIWALRHEDYEELVKQIKELPYDEAAALRYEVVAPATPVSPNTQGRVTLPQLIREEVNIKEKAIVLGMDNHVEIWDSETFAAFRKVQREENLEKAKRSLRF